MIYFDNPFTSNCKDHLFKEQNSYWRETSGYFSNEEASFKQRPPILFPPQDQR